MRIHLRQALLTSTVLVPLAVFVWQQSAPSAAKPARRPGNAAKTQTGTKEAAKPAPALAPAPRPLANPPDIIKAIYFTGWSAGLKTRVAYAIDLAKTTEINSVVFDVKDYSGNVSYRTGVTDAQRYGAVRVMVRDVDGFIARLHQEGIYVIARITCFQDPVLAEARPEWAVHRVSKLPQERRAPLTRDSVWRDHKGLAWINPASRPAWNYLVAIARDVLARGADEVNFDYVRFPSDGDLKDMYFPGWDPKTPKREVIRAFFHHLRTELPGTRISADVFGLATVNDDDLGIGQVIEDAYGSFDAVCPMVYPSHFARKFLGFPNPAAKPYEVVNYSMKEANDRLRTFSSPPAPPAKPAGGEAPAATVKLKAARLRPWLQDFNMGAKYDAAAVRAQIRAVEDALGDGFAGYMIWSPSNVYTRQGLVPPPKPEKLATTAPTS
ncbi:MAG TPA: putative glycoside hydrolase [Bryobacteraceae bacterium]|nr:putative glycoside hydrolase [Bryobacteraceae bacterium]